jgi:hypothetical protein
MAAVRSILNTEDAWRSPLQVNVYVLESPEAGREGEVVCEQRGLPPLENYFNELFSLSQSLMEGKGRVVLAVAGRGLSASRQSRKEWALRTGRLQRDAGADRSIATEVKELFKG